jgi:hypothetical protein
MNEKGIDWPMWKGLSARGQKSDAEGFFNFSSDFSGSDDKLLAWRVIAVCSAY